MAFPVKAPEPNPRLKVHAVHAEGDLLVVNKMPGMPSEPGKGHVRDTLLNAVANLDAARLARMGEPRDWGLLHRLDRPTSGLLAFAFEPALYDRLRGAFERREVGKTYLAIVRGSLPGTEGEVDLPLAEKHERGYRVSVPDRAGRPSLTRWRERSRAGRYALVECDLHTGRLHQIRVHLAMLGAPLAGDPLYVEGGLVRPARRREEDPQFHLHAWKLALPLAALRDEPSDSGRLALAGELPRRFRAFAGDRGLGLPSEALGPAGA